MFYIYVCIIHHRANNVGNFQERLLLLLLKLDNFIETRKFELSFEVDLVLASIRLSFQFFLPPN